MFSTRISFKIHISLRMVRTKTFNNIFLVLFLSPLLSFCSSSQASQTSVDVNVNLSSPIGTSQFSPAMTMVDNSLNYPWGNNSRAAINNVKSLVTNGISYVDTPIMAWGVADLWPNPAQSGPTNWSYLDSRMKFIVNAHAIPVLTLNEAPWWMKGHLNANGTTTLLTRSEEWSNIAYTSRILDNKMNDWLYLIQKIAERYMVPPYNVRYFQVWNELKGYYNPATNNYDYTTSPGNPSGPNAEHGYTYMYNRVYVRLREVAQSLGIAPDSIKVGGPYVVMDTWSSPQQGNASNISEPYGTFDQRPLEVVRYWLQHKDGAGFIAVDGGNVNKDNVNITDPFTASQKFADIVRWIRSLAPGGDYPGAGTLPIWFSEWYVSPFTQTSNQNYINALKTYAMIELIKAGGGAAFTWGGIGDGISNNGLWTNTTAGGGQPLPWYYSYAAFKRYFSPGTRLYATTISAPVSVDALASATTLMLVNKTPFTLTVHINNQKIRLAPYQVSISSL